MDKIKNIKHKLKEFYMLCPMAHTVGIVSAAVIVLHMLTRHNKGLMVKISENFVRPYHQTMAELLNSLPFSMAELLIWAAGVSVLAFVIYGSVRIAIEKERLKRLYKTVLPLAAFALLVYALFSVFWGTYYYADDFISRSGLKNERISVEQLKTVTRYFADMANEYSEKVTRDENGFYRPDREEILELSPELYENAEEKFPCLQGEALKAKPFRFSGILSYTDFTGFFFPFTGEANVNIDFPPNLFPSTVAHELAHQRGIAKEQEANFAAVLVSLEYGQTDYVYSAALLAYTHLGNALYKADYEAWKEISGKLGEYVLLDFAENRLYWEKFEGPAQSTMNKVYEGFLQSYDQKLGLKSYGACVDLLVNYYYDEALKAVN